MYIIKQRTTPGQDSRDENGPDGTTTELSGFHKRRDIKRNHQRESRTVTLINNIPRTYGEYVLLSTLQAER